MPLYAYRCSRCYLDFDRIQTVERSTMATACPQCERQADRILSPSALRFLGDGWTPKSTKERTK